MGPRSSLMLMLVVCLSACKSPLPGADAVARVNGESITRKDFDDLVERNLRRYTNESQPLAQGIRSRIQEGVLRRMVDDLMVAQRCKQEGIRVDDQELNQHFSEHQGRFRNAQAFTDYLSRSDTTEAALKEDLRKSLMRDRLVDKLTGPLTVTDAEVEQYYQNNSNQFKEPQKMHVRRLLLRTSSQTSQAQTAAVAKKAHKLRDQVKHHSKDFATWCEKHSQGPEAAHGGSMGIVTTGRMAELDRWLAQGLPADGISPVLETPLGFEIYQVSDLVKEHQRPLAAEARAIREALLMRRRNDRRQEVLRSLKNGASVQMLISFAPDAAAAATGVPAGAAKKLVR